MALVSEMIKEWVQCEKELHKDMAQIMEKYDEITPQILAVIVSTLCGISVADMLTEKRNHRVFARWLLYYAYRHVTSASYDKICEMFVYDGCKPSYSSVRNGILNFPSVMETNKYWDDKWRVVKAIICKKEIEQKENKQTKHVITINVPKELRESITIKINGL